MTRNEFSLFPKPSHIRRLKRRLAGLCRVAAYLTCVAAASSFFLLRAADARMSEAVQRFGDSLVKQLGPDLVGDSQHLVINGQSVFFSSAVVERDLVATLDALQTHCKAQSSPALSNVGKLPAVLRGQLVSEQLRDPVQWAVNRYDTQDASAGQVACIAHPQDGADLSTAMDRVLRFIESGDLSEVGNARYFLARGLGEGRSQVLSVWTEGKFDLLGMFPSQGDAPGEDVEGVPRPPSARRAFSAVVPGRPYQVNVYESRAAREEILAHYDATLPTAGWIERPMSADDELRVLARAFNRGDQLLFVVLDAQRQHETPVTLVRIGGRGFVDYAKLLRDAVPSTASR